jgi:oxygen-dependent protoporphyrinogen oxidase
VVGAGLSGLATAWRLADRGFSVTIVEAGPRAGGLIHTEQTPHGPVETAANAFLWTDTVCRWFADLEIEPAFARPESKRRYIFRGDRPRRWPLTVAESAKMAWRLGVTALGRSFAPRSGETVAAWGDRALGSAASRWLLEPAMMGIYAAPAGTLSAPAVFGGRRRGRFRMAAPRGGMGEFVERLERRLVERGVTFEYRKSVTGIEADVRTAVCTNAPEAARLIEPHAPGIAAAIARIRLSPLATVTAFFEPHRDDIRGFGVLFPPTSGAHASGVLMNTEIFDGRGSARSEAWIFSDREGAATRWTDADLLGAIAEDRHRLTRRKAEPVYTRITRWPHGIPVYDDAVVETRSMRGSLPPWLTLSGNYLGALGVARLLEIAEESAARLAEGR